MIDPKRIMPLLTNMTVDGLLASGPSAKVYLVTRRIDGKKLAMMGFNNSAYGKIMHPTLTSVEIFPRFLGSEAAALAIDSNLKIESNCVIVPHKVIERESTRI